MLGTPVQGYLAHKKRTPPKDDPRALGIGLQQGPGGVRFLMCEVPYRGTSFIRNAPLPRTTIGP